MKRSVGMSLILLFFVFFLPWLRSESHGALTQDRGEDSPPTESASPPPVEITHEASPTIDSGTSLRVLIDGQLQTLSMEDYLTGVLRSEMPASFAPEALKAQAVAARTYTLYRMENNANANHPEADACDDITCCKGYMDALSAAENWGDEAGEYEEKLHRAVLETDGECVLYDGRPVLAVFHSSSSSVTQDSAAVWGGSLPYLQSVPSPESADTVPNYHSTAAFSPQELETLLKEALPEASLSGAASNWFSNIHQQESGTVTSLTVGGVEVSGNTLRTILGLRSPCFTISFPEGSVVFSVTGYGHGVGMSQYGANILAGEGKTYREILTWYYTGTAVGTYIPSSAQHLP